MSIPLPIEFHPPLTAYDRYAFWLSIVLGTHPDALPWIAAQFMQIQSVMDSGDVTLLPYAACFRNLNAEPWLTVQTVTIKPQARRRDFADMMSVAKDRLKHGHYVIAALDDHAVSVLTDDGPLPAYYPCLLYGYDDQTQSFFALGNVGKPVYRPFTLTYAEFERGLCGSRLASYTLEFVQVSPQAEFTLTPSIAVQALRNYRAPPSENRGMRAVQSWLERWDVHSQHGFRSWLVFEEHLRLTSRLLRQSPLGCDGHSYTPVVCHARMISGWIADYRLSGDTEALSQIRRELADLLQQEGRTLDRCIRAAICSKL